MDQTGIKIRSQMESRWTKSIFLRVGVEGVNPFSEHLCMPDAVLASSCVFSLNPNSSPGG